MCQCERVHVPPCFSCRNPRTPEESEAFVRAGIERFIGKNQDRTLTREQEFEAERARLAKKRHRKRKG